MPKLLKNIEGYITDTNIGVVNCDDLFTGVLGYGDYMKLYRFTGFFIDLSKSNTITEYTQPKNIGIKNNNRIFTELNISY
jgi:hypothetical protein